MSVWLLVLASVGAVVAGLVIAAAILAAGQSEERPGVLEFDTPAGRDVLRRRDA